MGLKHVCSHSSPQLVGAGRSLESATGFRKGWRVLLSGGKAGRGPAAAPCREKQGRVLPAGRLSLGQPGCPTLKPHPPVSESGSPHSGQVRTQARDARQEARVPVRGWGRTDRGRSDGPSVSHGQVQPAPQNGRKASRNGGRLALGLTPASVFPRVGGDKEAHPAQLSGRGLEPRAVRSASAGTRLTMSLKAPRTAAVTTPRSAPSTFSAAEAQSSRYRCSTSRQERMPANS